MRRPILLAMAVAMTLSGCDPCDNEISRTIISPSGKLKAVVFNRSCGATTGFTTQVSIIPAAASLPDDGGNTLVLDGTVPLQLAWRTDSTLRLHGLGTARIFHQFHSFAGVAVEYEN